MDLGLWSTIEEIRNPEKEGAVFFQCDTYRPGANFEEQFKKEKYQRVNKAYVKLRNDNHAWRAMIFLINNCLVKSETHIEVLLKNDKIKMICCEKSKVKRMKIVGLSKSSCVNFPSNAQGIPMKGACS